MGKKTVLVVAGIALLVAGMYAGMRFAGDNRGTVVGDALRYNTATTGSNILTRSVGGSGTGSIHEVRDGDSIQAAVAAVQPGDIRRRQDVSGAEHCACHA